MKSSQSNFNLQLPGSYLARSYLIATVTKCYIFWKNNYMKRETGKCVYYFDSQEVA